MLLPFEPSLPEPGCWPLPPVATRRGRVSPEGSTFPAKILSEPALRPCAPFWPAVLPSAFFALSRAHASGAGVDGRVGRRPVDAARVDDDLGLGQQNSPRTSSVSQ